MSCAFIRSIIHYDEANENTCTYTHAVLKPAELFRKGKKKREHPVLWCVTEEVRTLLSSWTCDLAQEVSEHSADCHAGREREREKEVLPIYISACKKEKKKDLVAMETARRCCSSSATGLHPGSAGLSCSHSLQVPHVPEPPPPSVGQFQHSRWQKV